MSVLPCVRKLVIFVQDDKLKSSVSAPYRKSKLKLLHVLANRSSPSRGVVARYV